MLAPPSHFLAGVVEGFYGVPWQRTERLELFDWLGPLGRAGVEPTYLYAPKDDLHHRALWREPYDLATASGLASLVRECAARGVRFIYGLGPGLDLSYTDPEDRRALRARFAQLQSLGCRDFALLFDDIPDALPREARARFGSFAGAQADVARELLDVVHADSRANRFLFCPTPYCGRMAARGLGGDGYLGELGRSLPAAIDILWTGPEIISEAIPPSSLRDLAALLRRPPIIWDNLFANDYDLRRLYLGPYEGRPREILGLTRGILLNPNEEFAANRLPVRSFGDWIASIDDTPDLRALWLRSVAEWARRLETVTGREIATEDLVLFADSLYLPHRLGDSASAFLEDLRQLARRANVDGAAPDDDLADRCRDRARRIIALFGRLTELRDRGTFAALHRHAWELKEEMGLVLEFLRQAPAAGESFASDEHLAKTYRGGFVADVQRLFHQERDGRLRRAEVAT